MAKPNPSVSNCGLVIVQVDKDSQDVYQPPPIIHWQQQQQQQQSSLVPVSEEVIVVNNEDEDYHSDEGGFRSSQILYRSRLFPSSTVLIVRIIATMYTN